MSSDFVREVRRKERFRFFLYYGLIMIFVYHGVHGFVYGKNGLKDAQKLTQQIKRYEQKASRLKEKIALVKAEITAFEKDPFKIELYARQSLQMIKPEEKLFLCKT